MIEEQLCRYTQGQIDSFYKEHGKYPLAECADIEGQEPTLENVCKVDQEGWCYGTVQGEWWEDAKIIDELWQDDVKT